MQYVFFVTNYKGVSYIHINPNTYEIQTTKYPISYFRSIFCE